MITYKYPLGLQIVVDGSVRAIEKRCIEEIDSSHRYFLLGGWWTERGIDILIEDQL